MKTKAVLISKKYFVFLFFSFFISAIVYGQNQQLLYQPFEFNNTTDTSATGIGSNTGANQWTLNNHYAGDGTYPTTVDQNSTYSGTINGAPYSRYLHIFDNIYAMSGGVRNCNYDPGSASDQFAIVDTHGVCTMGYDTVWFSFFYTCMGDTNNAYGQVYYSRNSGPWLLASQQHYSNKTMWKYELITNPAFANATNLRFGFRWVNNASAAPHTTSMAVDDVQIVAFFDSIGGASDTITALVSPLTVCAGQYLNINFLLSDTLCDGFYDIQLSDGFGDFSFPSHIHNNWPINYPNTTMQFPYQWQVPTSIFPGTCYRIRFVRFIPTQAAPLVIIESPCINITLCPNTITTQQPVVTLDSNAVCAGSAIDVPFLSTGTFNGNQYIAQLSDINGNFNNPTILGTFNSDVTYDPLFPNPSYPPPGIVSGLIPDTVSAGCNYYVRIIATGPVPGPAPSVAWGPFCIQHCDIYLNQQDINVCLYPDTSFTLSIPISVHHYNTNTVYNAGNQFQTQLISMGPFPPPFTQVGSNGVFGSVIATNSTTLQLNIFLSQFQSQGIPPGRYYLRIVATNTNFPDSAFGNLIRITIGAPSHTAPSYFAFSYPSFQPLTSDTLCQGDMVYFFTSGNPGSSYRWMVNSSYFIQNPLLLLFNTSGNLTVRLQENNFGCYGPLSAPRIFTSIGTPNANITGPANVCVGDTVLYQTPFQNSTFYLWSVNSTHGTIVDTSNNQVECTFDSIGTYQISVYAINQCFDTTGYRTVTVHPYPAQPTIIQNGNMLICSITAANYKWYRNTVWQSAYTNDTIVIAATDNGSWQVEIWNNLACKSMSLPYSTDVGIQELTEENFSIFPNPVEKELRIKNAELKIERIEVYDALGKKLFSQISNLKSQISVDVSKLPSGIYFVTVIGKDQSKVTKKFVKTN